MSTFVTALARVSPALRSLTGIVKVTEPFAGRDAAHPLRELGRQPASSVLLVPPSDCAGVPLVDVDEDRRSREVDVFVGSEIGADSGGEAARLPTVTPGIRAAATTARPTEEVRERFGGRPRAARATGDVTRRQAS